MILEEMTRLERTAELSLSFHELLKKLSLTELQKLQAQLDLIPLLAAGDIVFHETTFATHIDYAKSMREVRKAAGINASLRQRLSDWWDSWQEHEKGPIRTVFIHLIAVPANYRAHQVFYALTRYNMRFAYLLETCAFSSQHGIPLHNTAGALHTVLDPQIAPKHSGQALHCISREQSGELRLRTKPVDYWMKKPSKHPPKWIFYVATHANVGENEQTPYAPSRPPRAT